MQFNCIRIRYQTPTESVFTFNAQLDQMSNAIYAHQITRNTSFNFPGIPRGLRLHPDGKFTATRCLLLGEVDGSRQDLDTVAAFQ